MDVKQAVQSKLKQILLRAASILFPLQGDEIQSLIKLHSWRDRNYVGEVNSKVSAWNGHSINLAYIDSRYRGLFGDYVQNNLAVAERIRLFGNDFAITIQSLDGFVVIFNLDIPFSAIEIVKTLGFIPRMMKRNSHICLIYSPDDFLQTSQEFISLKVAEMVILQRNIAIHRKPLDSLELPFQHFLYQSNYLHGLVVKQGLWLQTVSKPRKSGDFGHDLEIQAISPMTQESLSIGVEIFMSGWGYHISSVPSYIQNFGLDGLIIISKDMPNDVITQLETVLNRRIAIIQKLDLISGQSLDFPIYHLSLGDLINELFDLDSQLEILLSQTRKADLESRDQLLTDSDD